MNSVNALSPEHLNAFIESNRLGSEERLYAVTDAARDHALAFAARDILYASMTSVFPTLIDSMKDVSPYLSPVDEGNSAYMEYLGHWGEALGTSSGILFLSGETFDLIRIQIRRMFFVEGPRGERLYFRFYDPRVLRAYLPTCTEDEAELFFGPIRAFMVEAEVPGAMLVCTRAPGGVQISAFTDIGIRRGGTFNAALSLMRSSADATARRSEGDRR